MRKASFTIDLWIDDALYTGWLEGLPKLTPMDLIAIISETVSENPANLIDLNYEVEV